MDCVRGMLAPVTNQEVREAISSLYTAVSVLFEQRLLLIPSRVEAEVRDGNHNFHACASELQELHLLLCRGWVVRVRHIPREANATPDCLAGEGLNCGVASRSLGIRLVV